MAQKIRVVLPFLRDLDEGLPNASVAAALYQGFGMSAVDTVSEILAAPAMAPGGPDEGLSVPGAASGDPLAPAPSRPDAAAAAAGLPGLGASASAEAASEDEARRAYQRLHLDLCPPLDSKFHDYVPADDPVVALSGFKVIGKAQQWRALDVGDARALAEAVEAAWGSGDYGSLSLAARTTLAAATEMSEFADGLLAAILASTPSGQRGFAVWRASQVACGDFIVASADRAAVADPRRTSPAVDLRAANKAGGESPLGARVGPLLAVLVASKRPVSKEDGRQTEKQLKAS